MTADRTVIIPVKPLPWYRKLFRALHLTTDAQIFIGMFVFLVIGYYITQATSHRQGAPVKAGTNTVKISIQPGSSAMPPNTTFQLWATADNPAAFITVKIVFDPKMVKLTGELSTAPSPLTRIVKQTAMSEANTTGIINLSLALDPTKKTTPPTGTFELATIPMAPNTTTQNLTTTLHLDSSVMQAVNADSTLFTITTADSSLTLNPSPTPTPTSTPTPVPADTVPPTVQITNPVEGGTVIKGVPVTISATATDTVGVTKVVFLVNGSTSCTDTSEPYACAWTPRGKAGPDTLTVKAYDAAGNEGTASITVTMVDGK